MKKKVIALSLFLSLVFISGSVANAASVSKIEMDSGEELRERVYEEVLNGDITNDADVIKVALEQYEDRMNQRAGLSTPEQKQAVNNSLSITQVLDRYTDDNGNVIEDIVTTGLVVLDENNNLVRADRVTTGSAGLNEYSIYATMNVSVTINANSDKVRFNWFNTRLTYGTAITAGSLIQDSKYTPEPFWEYSDIVKQISYPQANVNYTYYPSNTDMVQFINNGCGRSCKSTINAGSRYFIMSYTVAHNTNIPAGDWYTEYH